MFLITSVIYNGRSCSLATVIVNVCRWESLPKDSSYRAVWRLRIFSVFCNTWRLFILIMMPVSIKIIYLSWSRGSSFSWLLFSKTSGASTIMMNIKVTCSSVTNVSDVVSCRLRLFLTEQTSALKVLLIYRTRSVDTAISFLTLFWNETSIVCACWYCLDKQSCLNKHLPKVLWPMAFRTRSNVPASEPRWRSMLWWIWSNLCRSVSFPRLRMAFSEVS